MAAVFSTIDSILLERLDVSDGACILQGGIFFVIHLISWYMYMYTQKVACNTEIQYELNKWKYNETYSQHNAN